MLEVGTEIYVRSLAWTGFGVVVWARGSRVRVRVPGNGKRREHTVKADRCTEVARSPKSNEIVRPFNTKRRELTAVPKNPPVRDKDYLAWVRTQSCCRCGRIGPSEPSHHPIEMVGAMGLKTDDDRCIPLCAGCHRTGPLAHHTVPFGRAWVEDQIEQHRARYLAEVAA